MKKNNFISATLLASALALSPFVVTIVNASTQSTMNVTATSIASVLYRRGLNEDSAMKISNKFVDENDVLLFAMISNLECGCSVLSKEEIFNYLSTAALRGESVNLDDYSFLVGMVQNIKKRQLSSETLKELQSIASRNSIYT